MKIKAVKVLDDGMSETQASFLWDKIEGFAGYAFNKSHSVEYTIISYWCMWLKVNYAVEFFAAAMTVADDNDKLANLVMDARRAGIEVLPPDINISTDRIEIGSDKVLHAPFQAVKGVSAKTAARIVRVREHIGRPFASREDFDKAAIAAELSGKINVAVRRNLDLVGAFASIEPGQKPAMHTERLRDRLELMAGFTVDAVKATRGVTMDTVSEARIIRLATDLKSCDGCSLKDKPHAMPQFGKKPRFMMVFDAPSAAETKLGKMMAGSTNGNANAVFAALNEAGLGPGDGYYTSLVRAAKPVGAKQLTNEQINGCSKWLDLEIETLRPPVIVAMGSNAIRHFAPGIKGSPAELAGKVIYRPDLDASIVFGINPAMIYHDGSKVTCLRDAIFKLSELL